jgi:hypothetical protein
MSWKMVLFVLHTVASSLGTAVYIHRYCRIPINLLCLNVALVDRTVVAMKSLVIYIFYFFVTVGKGGQFFGFFFVLFWFGNVSFVYSLCTFQLKYSLSYIFSTTRDPSVLFEWIRIQTVTQFITANALCCVG